jgi:hypothetical protein
LAPVGFWSIPVLHNFTKNPNRKRAKNHAKSYRSLSKDTLIDRGTESYCIMCEIHYDLPQAFSSIRKHGICQFCKAFSEVLISTVRMWRLPSFEEAVEAEEKRHYDAVVILKAYRELEIKLKDLEPKQ